MYKKSSQSNGKKSASKKKFCEKSAESHLMWRWNCGLPFEPTHKMWTFENRTNSYTSKNLQSYNRKTKTGEKSYWLHFKHLTAKHVAAQEIKNSSQLMQLLYQQPAQTIETLFNYLSEIIYLNVTWIKDGFQKTSFWRRLKKHFAFKLLEILKYNLP